MGTMCTTVVPIIWLVVAVCAGLVLYRKTKDASVRVNGTIKKLTVGARIGGAGALTVVTYLMLLGGDWWLKRPPEANAALSPEIYAAFVELSQSVATSKAECTRPGPKEDCGSSVDAIADRVSRVKTFLNAARPGIAPP
jgi:hypothetical protein